MNIYFWQKTLSPHQSDFINELSKTYNVTLLVEEDLPEWRKNMGWSLKENSYGSAKIILNPQNNIISKIFSESNSSDIHIFSGFGNKDLVYRAFKISRNFSIIRGIMAESRNSSGIMGKVRLAKGIIERKRFSKDINFILAIGSLGLKYFEKVGYQKSIIMPFGYFVSGKSIKNSDSKEKFNVIYSGRLTKEKGVDNLFEALPLITNVEYECNFWGEGKLREKLERKASNRKMSNIHFHNFIDRDLMINKIGAADLLVLPSRKKDGWGVVINEALMVGTPVLVSSQCGSSIMFKNNNLLGSTYNSSNTKELKSILYEKINKGKITSETRENIKIWSSKIDAKNAAYYLINIIDFINGTNEKPNPPWEEGID